MIGLLARLFAWAGVAMLLAATAAVFYSVVMRYLLDQPQTWSDELVGYLTVGMVMFGAAEALRRRDHVGVDLLTVRAGARLRRIVDLWGTLAVVVVSAALLVGGWEMVAFSRMVGLMSDGYLEAPMWVPQLALPVGMAMVCLLGIVRILRLLRGADREA